MEPSHDYAGVRNLDTLQTEPNPAVSPTIINVLFLLESTWILSDALQ